MSRVEDTALLQAPVHMGNDGLESIIRIWSDATIEVKNILNNECNILLQCRYCRNVFRSLINFISHKRGFCRTLYGSPSETVATKCQENSTQSVDKSDVDVAGTHKAVKKTKGLLKRLNIVGVLNKRIEHSEVDGSNSKYDLLTLPKVERTIPETTFTNGVQVLKTRPKSVDQNRLVAKHRTALVIPQDHCVQYLDMNLRRRENNQKENCVREVGDDEVSVMDRLERLKPGLADFGTLKCLCKKCEEVNSFISIFVLAYHISIKHNTRCLPDGYLICFVCGNHFLNYSMLVDHLQKTHAELRKLHYDTRSLQALEKEQKRSRKMKNGEAKVHCATTERLRSLSPCTEEEIDEIMADVSDQRIDEQQRLKFLHSRSDRNLEKSDDDEMALQLDEGEQASDSYDDQAILDSIYCIINQICKDEDVKLFVEPSRSPVSSDSVKSTNISRSSNCTKALSHANHEPSSNGTECVDVSERVDVLGTVAHSSNDANYEGSSVKGTQHDEAVSRQDVDAEDNSAKVPSKVETNESNLKQEVKEIVEDSDEQDSDSKKLRKMRCDKGKKRNRKRGRKAIRATVAANDGPDKQPPSKRVCNRLKCEIVEPVRQNLYNTRRCVLESGANITATQSSASISLPTSTATATVTTSNIAKLKVTGTKTEGTYLCKKGAVKHKILQKEVPKTGQEILKTKPQSCAQYEKGVQKSITLKRVAPSDNSHAKRLLIDGLRGSTVNNTTAVQKPSGQTSGTPGETVRYRYRRFSHQCLPISSIDVVFVPKRKSTGAITKQVPHIKDAGPSNLDTTSDAMKKTGAFLRRNYLSQRKDDPAVVATQNGAGNAASFMDPSSIPVYMTEAENRAIFSFVVPDKTAPGKLYRCRYCNETFESEMDSRKHAVGHLRIIRLRCSLCGCCSFFCSDMRIHLQMRHCEKLSRAPAHIVAPGRKIPCMTYNQADSLIEVAVKEKPGRVAFTSGKIISNVSYKPYYPDAVTERKILENTSLRDITETVP